MPIALQLKVTKLLELFLATPSDARTIDRDAAPAKREKYRELAEIISQRIQGIRTSQSMSPISRERVCPPRTGPDSSRHAYFMLRAIPKESALPVMRLSYDFQAAKLKISMRVLLFMHHDKGIKAQGFRFESPEGTGAADEQESTHEYFHSQQITSFEKNDNRFPAEVAPWTFVSQPAFCLDASNPIQLVLNFFISLYGLTEVKSRLRGQQVWAEIKNDLTSMHVRQRFPLGS